MSFEPPGGTSFICEGGQALQGAARSKEASIAKSIPRMEAFIRQRRASRPSLGLEALHD